MKYLRPIYSALFANLDTRARALRTFERYRRGYHPIAQQVVASRLK
jgi:hypothetical protein